MLLLSLAAVLRPDLELQRQDRNHGPKWDFEEEQPMPGRYRLSGMKLLLEGAVAIRSLT